MSTDTARISATTARVRCLLALEVRAQWRYGTVVLVAALTAVWTLVLAFLPADTAGTVAPWLLLLEIALLGTLLAGALVLLDRSHGMLAALTVSPARAGEYLAAKVGLLTALVTLSAVPVALAGRPETIGSVLAVVAGAGLIGLLAMLLSVAVAVRRQSVITFMVALPLVLLPLITPAMAYGAGLAHPLLYAVPSTGAMALMQTGFVDGGPGPLGLVAATVWLLVAAAAAGWVSGRVLHRTSARGPSGARTTVAVGARQLRPARGPMRALLRSDLSSIRRDPLLLVVGLSPLLLALLLRLGYPPVQSWLQDAHDVDLAPYRPVLLGAAVLLHVPMTFGIVGAFLTLDDVDERALVALRTSPLTLTRYLSYRAGLAAVLALAGVAVAVPLSGMAPWSEWPAVVLAGVLAALLAAVTTVATLAMARNKVEGVAALKLLGLPLHAPIAAWWLTGAAGGAFAVLPSWWVLQTLWHPWPLTSAYALGATLVTGVALLVLGRRSRRLLAAV